MSLPKNAVVWAEIPVTDLDRARAFYEAVLQQEMKPEEGAPFPMFNFQCVDAKAGVAGHIYVGKPAAKGTGPTIHFAAPDTVEEMSERVRAAGGEVVSDIMTIPAGRFAYAVDPDGNSIGLFEA